MVGVYAAAAAVGTIYVSAVVVTTSIVGTAQESGYLGAAFRVYTVLATIPLLLVSSAFPVLARAAHTDHERLQYAVQRLVDVSLIVGTWVALSTILGADVAIRVIAGEEFAPAVPVLQVQGAALFVGFLAITGAFALVSLHRHVVLLAGNLAGLAVIVALTVILVPEYGAKGSAIATLAAETGLVLLYGLTLFARRFVHYEVELVPRIAAAGLLTAALALTSLDGIALVLAATVVYWTALILLRGLPHEVIDALLRRDPRTSR
jgi:O-antigen/teichoic acid export membrane protein